MNKNIEIRTVSDPDNGKYYIATRARAGLIFCDDMTPDADGFLIPTGEESAFTWAEISRRGCNPADIVDAIERMPYLKEWDDTLTAMDPELRERVAASIDECDRDDFLRAYMDLHFEERHEDFLNEFPVLLERARRRAGWDADAVEIEDVSPCYTGGGIYVFYGALSDGTYFMAEDCGLAVEILDEDPREDLDLSSYVDWQEEHLLLELNVNQLEPFFRSMLDWIIRNEPNDAFCNYCMNDMKADLAAIPGMIAEMK